MSVNLHYEDKARSAGFSSVCGVDEAGAGARVSTARRTPRRGGRGNA